jgi:hypothetical protein
MTLAVAIKTAAMALATNYGVHVGSSFAYTKFCVPQTVWDVAQSFATTASPVCTFLLNTMQVTQNNFAVLVTSTVLGIVSGVLKHS